MTSLQRLRSHFRIPGCSNIHTVNNHQFSRSFRQYSTRNFESTTGRQSRKIPPGTTRTFAAALTASASAYLIGSVYPPDTLTYVFPRPAPGPPDPTLPSSKAYSAVLEAELNSLPLLRSLRAAPDANEWYESRPYEGYPEEKRVNHLTGGALRGPGKLGVVPLIRARNDEKENIIVTHVGRGLCGHDGIIHGGLLATLLDESLGRIALKNLPERVGVTATLSLDYRAPTKADQFIVIRTFVKSVSGRKCHVEGRIEDLDGKVLVEGRALFIQPKYAKLLNVNQIKTALGEPKEASTAVQS